MLWGEAVVAYQFHALNVKGSNPFLTKEELLAYLVELVDTMDLKSILLGGLGSSPRIGRGSGLMVWYWIVYPGDAGSSPVFLVWVRE